jgi:small-conductance mechanosensitive channel
VSAVLSISDSIERGFDTFFEWLPALVGAIVVLIIGYFIAKFVGKLIATLLERAGFDRSMHSGPAGEWVSKVSASPSGLIGRIAFWVLFLAFVSIAASVLGIAAVSAFVAAIWSYIPNVIAALAIFLVAGAIAAGIATLATRLMGDTPTGRVIATAAPILVMTIATFMILEQLKIAHDIVVTTYTLVLGSIALAAALAFGLGGRDVAGRMLEGAYDKGQRESDQVKRDIRQGRAEAQRMKEERERSQRTESSDSSGYPDSEPRTVIR